LLTADRSVDSDMANLAVKSKEGELVAQRLG
jgi:hypothetical protein